MDDTPFTFARPRMQPGCRIRLVFKVKAFLKFHRLPFQTQSANPFLPPNLSKKGNRAHEDHIHATVYRAIHIEDQPPSPLVTLQPRFSQSPDTIAGGVY